MRTLGAFVLALLWTVALVLYSAPVWLHRFVSVDLWVDPPGQAPGVRLVAIGLSVIPLLLLAWITVRFARSRG